MTPDIIYTIAAFIAAFIIGSIPFGYLIGKIFYGVNILEQGSGGTGMANVARVFGKKAGVATLILDFLKGYVPAYIAAHVIDGGIAFVPAVTFAAVLGHCFVPWLKFKGGKGVATALGAFSVVAPIPVTAIAIATYLLARWITKISAVGSFCLLMVFMAFFSCAAFSGCKVFASAGSIEIDTNYFISAALTFILILYRHKDNMVRMLNKEELKLEI